MQPILHISIGLMSDGKVALQLPVQSGTLTAMDKVAFLGLLQAGIAALHSLPTAEASPIQVANGAIPPMGGLRRG